MFHPNAQGVFRVERHPETAAERGKSGRAEKRQSRLRKYRARVARNRYTSISGEKLSITYKQKRIAPKIPIAHPPIFSSKISSSSSAILPPSNAPLPPSFPSPGNPIRPTKTKPPPSTIIPNRRIAAISDKSATIVPKR